MVARSAFVFSFLISLSASAVILPTPRETPSSTAVEKRNDATLTVQLGPLTNYVKPTSAATTLVGREFQIQPVYGAGDGLNLLFGPDLAKDLKNAVNTDCPLTPTTNWANCQASVEKLIPQQSIQLQRRSNAVLFAVGGLGALIGVIVQFYRDLDFSPSKVVTQNLHIAGTDVAKLENTASNTIVVFPTATDDKNVPTITITPTSVPIPTTTIEENGDFTIHLDPEFARILDELIAVNAGCAKARRGLNARLDDTLLQLDSSDPQITDRIFKVLENPTADFWNCITTIGDKIMANMPNGPAAPLAPLLPVKEAVPPIFGAAGAKAVSVGFASKAATKLKHLFYTPKQLQRVGIMTTTYTVVRVSGITLGSVIRLGGRLFEEVSKKTRDCPASPLKCSDGGCDGENSLCTVGENANCPCSDGCMAQDITPYCDNCGGESWLPSRCTGFPDYNGLWSGCPCIRNIDDQPYMIDEADFANTQKVIANLPKMLELTPQNHNCSEQKEVANDKTKFPEVFHLFCKDFDLTENKTQLLGASPLIANSLLYEALKLDVAVLWRPKIIGEECFLSCEDVFSALLVEKSCVDNGNPSLDADIITDCGSASWTVNKIAPVVALKPSSTLAPISPPTIAPPPPPSPPPLPAPGLSGQTCYQYADFPGAGDISSQAQNNYAIQFCKDWENQKMTATSPALKRNPHDASFGTAWKPYHFTVSWIAGCKTSATEQSVHKPLGPEHELGANCELLARENYMHCYNGGVGGYRDAGCLRYSFSATKDINAA